MILIMCRILAQRLEDLEARLKTINQGETIMSPSLQLLNDCALASDENEVESCSMGGKYHTLYDYITCTTVRSI